MLKLQEIYLIRLGQTELYKIGVSKNSKKRIKQLQTGCPYQLTIANVYKTVQPYKIESILHSGFVAKKFSPTFLEDFDMLKGEWFTLTLQDVLDFTNRCEQIEKNIQLLKEAGNPFV
jgi:hypothetical protein